MPWIGRAPAFIAPPLERPVERLRETMGRSGLCNIAHATFNLSGVVIGWA
jgi:hypothetical protein